MPRELIENPDNPVQRNQNWQNTHIALSEIYANFLKKEGREPTLTELSEESKMSVRNIHRHIKIIKQKPFADRLEDLRLLTRRIILSQGALGATGLPGSTQAARFFMEMVEGIGGESKQNPNALNNLSGEEIEKQIEQMQGALSGKILKFVRNSPGLRGNSTGTDSKGV